MQPTMDLSSLRCSGGGGRGYVKRGQYTAVWVAVLGRRSAEKTTAAAARWKEVWRRVKKIMLCYGGAREVHVPYNPVTYLQNFDEGSLTMVEDDPDAICRSFSARFAISSAILQTPNQFVVHNKVEVL